MIPTAFAIDTSTNSELGINLGQDACLMYGNCILANLTIIGGYFNTSVENFNITGNMEVYGNITPYPDDTRLLGDLNNRWKSIYVGFNDGIHLGNGNVLVNSPVADQLGFYAPSHLGFTSATGDARFNTNLIPTTDATNDIGALTGGIGFDSRWNDLYLAGNVYLDVNNKSLYLGHDEKSSLTFNGSDTEFNTIGGFYFNSTVCDINGCIGSGGGGNVTVGGGNGSIQYNNDSELGGFGSWNGNLLNISPHNYTGNAYFVDNGEYMTSGYELGAGGGYVDLDGTGDYVDIADNNNLDVTNAITISAWIKPKALNQNDVIFVKGNGFGTPAQYSYQLGLFSTGVTLFRLSNGVSHFGSLVFNSDNFTVDEWGHVVVTWNGTTDTNGIKAYVNDILVKTATASNTTIQSTSDDVGIGGSDDTFIGDPARVFEGAIDEVMLFNKSLNSSAISELYNRSRNFASYNYSDNTSLISWWAFDDSTADDNVDGNNGVLIADAEVINEDILILNNFMYFSNDISATDFITRTQVDTSKNALSYFKDGNRLKTAEGIKYQNFGECYVPMVSGQHGVSQGCLIAKQSQALAQINNMDIDNRIKELKDNIDILKTELCNHDLTYGWCIRK